MRWIPWIGAAVFVSAAAYVASIPWVAGGFNALSVSFTLLAFAMGVYAISTARVSSLNIDFHRGAELPGDAPARLQRSQERWARVARLSFAFGMAVMINLIGLAMLGWLDW